MDGGILVISSPDGPMAQTLGQRYWIYLQAFGQRVRRIWGSIYIYVYIYIYNMYVCIYIYISL